MSVTPSTRSQTMRAPGLAMLVGLGVLLLLTVAGRALLSDADTYWHVAVGEWILEHGFPRTDPFSTTLAGEPWIAKEWLSQLLLAGAHAVGGWTGVALLAATTAATAFSLLAWFLGRRLALIPVLAGVAIAFVLAAPHLVARPHILALPVMVAFVGGLAAAADNRRSPSLLLLPLMTLWANLHGGFTLGILLVGAFGLDAAVSAASAERLRVAGRWAAFLVAVLVAASITPYGPESILVTFRILGLGSALSIIGEWQPQDFGSVGAFEAVLLLGIGLVLFRGIRLPPVRILILLGLLHLALSAVRNGELLGLLAPLVVAAPLAAQLPGIASPPGERSRSAPWPLLAAPVILGLGWFLGIAQLWAPDPTRTPAAAVAVIRDSDLGPVFNDYDFGGYLIAEGVAPFIDGRTELYGTDFVLRHHNAVTLANLPDLQRMLDEFGIEATLLSPRTPAVAFLDQDPGWRRFYADAVAVVHVRVSD